MLGKTSTDEKEDEVQSRFKEEDDFDFSTLKSTDGRHSAISSGS